MRSRIFQNILDNAKNEDRIFVRKYADMIVRINSILKRKNWTQKYLSEKLSKKPSEISKWFNGNHNFTLRSIAKLEAELEEDILIIPSNYTISDEQVERIKQENNDKDKKIMELEKQIQNLQETLISRKEEKTS